MTTGLTGRRRAGVRRAAAPTVMVGGTAALLSMGFMPWYGLRGDLGLSSGGVVAVTSGPDLVLSDPLPGHTTIAWVLVGLAALAGLLGLTLRAVAQTLARMLAVVLTAVLLAGLALSHRRSTEPDARQGRHVRGTGKRITPADPSFW